MSETESSQLEIGNHAEEVARILLETACVQFNFDKPFVYASGIESPIYTNCRLLISYPDERERIADFLAEAIQNTIPDFKEHFVCGMATAGIPHASWVAGKLHIGMVYKRSKPKDHGLKLLFEGVDVRGKRVFVVEDHITTGSSILDEVKGLREQEAAVEHAFSIFTYGITGTVKLAASNGMKFHSLCSLDTLLHVAAETGIISAEESKKVLSWRDSQDIEAIRH